MGMKNVLIAAVILFAQEKSWNCPGCKKDVPASEVKLQLCQEPHDKILHKKDCSSMRHTCRAEVTPVIATPLKAENPGVTPDGGGLFIATDAAAVLKGKPGLEAGKAAHLYVLLGASGNGADPLRAAHARADFDGKTRTVRVVITTVQWEKGPDVGTTDMCWVGWRFPLGKLDAGDVKLVVFREVETAPRPGAKPTSTSTPQFEKEQVFAVK
jgi:hypothetical protein